MEQGKYKSIMEQLERFSKEVGTESRRETLENGVELLSFLSAVYEDGSGLIYFQLALVRVQDSVDMAQIFTTVLPKIGQALPQLEQAIVSWNQNSILGSYGIYREEDQFYHRYRLPLDDNETAEVTANHITSAITLIYEEVSRRYEAAKAMVSGGLTWQEVQDRGLS